MAYLDGVRARASTEVWAHRNYTGFGMPRGARDEERNGAERSEASERARDPEREIEGGNERFSRVRGSASIRGNLAKGIENVRSLGKEIVASNGAKEMKRERERSSERARLSESVPGKRNRAGS